ncbi:MAG: flavodoxin-dependent (E)-4-hydroxy-3-methylbut-2-enyl-diphosphate synthase [Candidatus Cloacimonetes bacterium]|nr:flavodoxin-dependent (E)-4-hydroxy-3-methylbut-2-enyl-diphosphate synthase [Candidatus Cloacimonadota bacterium]MBL7085545.1 flavodoxin-dependent (E)-4-hydroxy-3-methylbut-2-enyl-diphosphate synthase [Candidatus Cloacimonadota bacterium]
MKRRKTREISIGIVKIGGNSPISIQSMTNTDTKNAKETIKQINQLENVGCDIVRIAIPDMKSANNIPIIQKSTNIPIIADIHFDYRLALQSVKNGIDALRINPGNIGSYDRIRKVVFAAKEAKIPIRIGVNSGSLEKDLKEKYGISARALTESALRHIRYFEKLKFYDIKISLKSSSVPLTIESYKEMAKHVDYPFHLGITEAGTSFAGTIKSAIGIGTLLSEGIGDTIRVSLTDNPIEEVKVGIEILKSLNLRAGPNIISCPTCARAEIDVIGIAKRVESEINKAKITQNLNVAIMGCIVNGPGEAKEADIGIAGGKNRTVLFKNGKKIKTIYEKDVVDILMNEIKKMV